MVTKRIKPLEYGACTDEQRRCWDAIAWCVGGHHHLRSVYECGLGVRTTIGSEAATFDGGLLTAFVLAAHHRAVRIAVSGGGPYRLAVECHARNHDGKSSYERHPRLQDLIARCVELSNTRTDGAS